MTSKAPRGRARGPGGSVDVRMHVAVLGDAQPPSAGGGKGLRGVPGEGLNAH
jgi:hypothetical protein